MRYIGIWLLLASAGFGQTVNGQAAGAGETAPFTLKITKVPAAIPLTATATCAVAKDASGGYPVQVGTAGITCTVVINKFAPSPGGAIVTATSTDPTIVITPASITIAPGNSSGSFQVTATP